MLKNLVVVDLSNQELERLISIIGYKAIPDSRKLILFNQAKKELERRNNEKKKMFVV